MKKLIVRHLYLQEQSLYFSLLKDIPLICSGRLFSNHQNCHERWTRGPSSGSTPSSASSEDLPCPLCPATYTVTKAEMLLRIARTGNIDRIFFLSDIYSFSITSHVYQDILFGKYHDNPMCWHRQFCTKSVDPD